MIDVTRCRLSLRLFDGESKSKLEIFQGLDFATSENGDGNKFHRLKVDAPTFASTFTLSPSVNVLCQYLTTGKKEQLSLFPVATHYCNLGYTCCDDNCCSFS